MFEQRQIIEGTYLQDLLSQPEVLERTCANLRPVPALQELAPTLTGRRIVLTGMGSSLYALYPLHLKLTAHGYFSHLVETAELIRTQSAALQGNALVVAVSQSGRSVEMARLLNEYKSNVEVIGLTNDETSPLGTASHIRLLMGAGPEGSVACKTFVSSLIWIEWIGAMLTREDPEPLRAQLSQAGPAAAAYLKNWRSHVEELYGLLGGLRQIFVVGRGRSLATAESGGLVLKESTHFAAEGMSSAAYRHGPFEVTDRDIAVVILGGDAQASPLNHGLARDVAEQGGRALLIGPDAEKASLRIPSVPDAVLPVLEMLPVQMVSLAIAALASRQAGRFVRGTKVTTVE